MGNRVPEVQSKIPMGIITFVDDIVSAWEVDKNGSPPFTVAFWESSATVQGWCEKTLTASRRCVWMVFAPEGAIVNSLFQIMSLVLPSLACRLRVQMR